MKLDIWAHKIVEFFSYRKKLDKRVSKYTPRIDFLRSLNSDELLIEYSHIKVIMKD